MDAASRERPVFRPPAYRDVDVAGDPIGIAALDPSVMPRRVRFLAARHPPSPPACSTSSPRALFAWQRLGRRSGATDPQTGGVTAVQRFGGALNLNVHFHTLVPDGVFELAGDGPARFVALRCPGDEELTAILTRFIRQAAKVLACFDDEVETEADALAALQARGGSAPPLPRPLQETEAASPTCASRSTTGRTWLPPSTSFAT